jgi:hypothetical protein
MRTFALLSGALILSASSARATAQDQERLLLNGRELRMQSTPLAPLLERREDLERAFPFMGSGCWRGYVGTWHIEGEQLYLVSLERESDPDLGAAGREEVPLSALFGEMALPCRRHGSPGPSESL